MTIGIGRVILSRSSKFSKGDLVISTFFSFSEYSIVAAKFLRVIDQTTRVEISAYLTTLGKTCDAPKPGGPLTTRQPAEHKWMSGYQTPLQKIGQSLLCTGSSTQLQNLHILFQTVQYMQYIQSHE